MGLVVFSGQRLIRRMDQALRDSRAHLQAYMRSEQRFSRLSESAPIIIFQTDAEGRIVYMNRCLYESLGSSVSLEFIGEHWSTLIHAEDREVVLESWAAMISDSTVEAAECRLISDGEHEPR